MQESRIVLGRHGHLQQHILKEVKITSLVLRLGGIDKHAHVGC